MDINKFMEITLGHMHRSNELLAAILLKLEKGETMQICVPTETVTALAEKREEKKTDKPEGSTKKAKEHDKTDVPADEKKYTAEDVRSALMALGKREGSNAAIELLQKYGSTSVSGLAEADYATIIKDALP